MKNNKKGFTLAEMLIVVAIIGVLIAILVPTFSAQLNKAKEAKDKANLRSAIAEVSAAGLTDGSAETQYITIETSISGEIGGVKNINLTAGSVSISWSGDQVVVANGSGSK